METKYIPGDSLAFVNFIKEKQAQGAAELKVIDEKFRWVIDGEYIARPQEANEA